MILRHHVNMEAPALSRLRSSGDVHTKEPRPECDRSTLSCRWLDWSSTAPLVAGLFPSSSLERLLSWGADDYSRSKIGEKP